MQIGMILSGLLAQATVTPPPLDLAAIIECRSDMGTYQAFAEKTTSRAPVGWARLRSSNPFLTEYRLARPITVFGRPTSRVAFANDGLLALFEGVEVKEIAAKLGVANDFGGRSTFLGEKVLQSKVEEDKELGSLFTNIVAVTVSTVDTHPGIVLAGCSYRVDVEAL